MNNLKERAKKFVSDHETLISNVKLVAGLTVATIGTALFVTDRNRIVDVHYNANDNGRERILTMKKNGHVDSFSRAIKID